MELSLLGLRVVREVGSRGSFSAAADALGYTQSAVSRQVAALEAAVGAPLFLREARGVRPTATGTVLLRHASVVLDHVAAAEVELAGAADGLAGRLVVGAFPTALAALVPGALTRLGEEHPGLEVRLREGGSPAQLRRLRAGRVDVAVVAAGGGLDYALEDLRADVVCEGGFRLAVGAHQRFAERGWVTVAELADARWIVGEAGDGGPQLGAWPTLTGTPRIAHAVRDWTARLGLVAGGAGITTIPELLAAALPAGVRTLAVDDPRPLRRALLAVTRPDRTSSAAAFVLALRREAAATSPASASTA